MTTVWILLLYVSGIREGGAMSNQFQTEEACIAAGEAFDAKLSDNIFDVYYTCVKNQ